MSFPEPPAAPPPAYPVGPPYGPPQPPGRLRGHTPRLLGWIFLGVGIALVIVGGVVGVTKSLSKVNGFQRFPIPATAGVVGTIHLDGTGKWVAYYEASNVSSSTRQVPLVGVALQGPSGQVMQLHTLYGNRSDGKIKIISYDYNGHKGVTLYQFDITTPGAYRVALQPNVNDGPDAKIAFGRSIEAGLVVGGVIIIVGVLLVVAAIVLLIVGFVKRSRHKKELAAPAVYFGGPPPGYGGPPPGYGGPPPGYGAPGYGGPPPGYGGPPPPPPGGWQQP